MGKIDMTILHMHEHYQGPEPLNYWPGNMTYTHQCHKCGSRTHEALPSDYSDPRFISSLIREMRRVLWYTHQTHNSLLALQEMFTARCGSEPKEVYREMTEKAAAMGANAVVSVDVDYESINGTMLMVSATGTAVVLE